MESAAGHQSAGGANRGAVAFIRAEATRLNLLMALSPAYEKVHTHGNPVFVARDSPGDRGADLPR